MTFRGIIHGKTIELENAPKLKDGQSVEVTVRPAPKNSTWGQGILRSAGVLSKEDPQEDDRILKMLQHERESGTRELPE